MFTCFGKELAKVLHHYILAKIKMWRKNANVTTIRYELVPLARKSIFHGWLRLVYICKRAVHHRESRVLFHFYKDNNSCQKENGHRREERFWNLPGSLLSANDQFDKGPVMFRTVTQTSSKELEERSAIRKWNQA